QHESADDVIGEISAVSSAAAGRSLWLLVTDRPPPWSIFSVTIFRNLKAVSPNKAAKKTREQNSREATYVTSDASRNRESRVLVGKNGRVLSRLQRLVSVIFNLQRAPGLKPLSQVLDQGRLCSRKISFLVRVGNQVIKRIPAFSFIVD